MSGPVQLQSIELLEINRAALLKFQEEAQAVINSTDMMLKRAWHWLDSEMPAFWNSRIKRLEFELSEARNALFRKRLQAQGTDHQAFDTVEKLEVKRLENELEKARQKLDIIRRWRTQFERSINEFNARFCGLRDEAGGGIERHLEFLKALSDIITAYSAIQTPTIQPPSDQKLAERSHVAKSVSDEDQS